MHCILTLIPEQLHAWDARDRRLKLTELVDPNLSRGESAHRRRFALRPRRGVLQVFDIFRSQAGERHGEEVAEAVVFFCLRRSGVALLDLARQLALSEEFGELATWAGLLRFRINKMDLA